MSLEFDTKFKSFNNWYRVNRYKKRTLGEHNEYVQFTFNKAMELLFYACNDLKQWKGLDVSSEFDKKNEQFNFWYEKNKSIDMDIKQRQKFQQTCLDEVMFQLAFACRDIRRLEGRMIEDPLAIAPNFAESCKGLG